MAKAELGVKRICLSCSMRFYDFKRSPIVCPGCGAEFDFKNLTKGKKSREVKKAKSKESISENAVDFEGEPSNGGDGPDKADAGNDDEINFDEEDEDEDENEDDTDETSLIRDNLRDDDPLLPSLDKKEE